VRQPADWKRQHGFPLDVEEVLSLNREAAGESRNHKAEPSGWPRHPPTACPPPEWQRVIVDHPERLLVALAVAPSAPGGERVLGFAARPDGWVLQAAKPVFVSGPGWPAAFPELAEEPRPEWWRQAWRDWCQPRGLPAGEIEACRLERRDYKLHVWAN